MHFPIIYSWGEFIYCRFEPFIINFKLADMCHSMWDVFQLEVVESIVHQKMENVSKFEKEVVAVGKKVYGDTYQPRCNAQDQMAAKPSLTVTIPNDKVGLLLESQLPVSLCLFIFIVPCVDNPEEGFSNLKWRWQLNKIEVSMFRRWAEI